MAYELHGMLTGAVDSATREKMMPAYGGGSESFLNNVVTPIYRVIKEVYFYDTLYFTTGLKPNWFCNFKKSKVWYCDFLDNDRS